MIGIVPALGTPYRVRDVIAGSMRLLSPRHALESEAHSGMRSAAGVDNVYFFNSGSSGFEAILACLRRFDARDEVIIPSYTCRTVGRTVRKAGLVPRIADVSLRNFSLDPVQVEQCLSGRTLAIIATHLFGSPCDISRIVTLARARNVHVIEDVAQGMGASVDGRKVGTFGDFSFYSFGKGKNLSIVSGGAVAVNNPRFRAEFERLYAGVSYPGFFDQVLRCVLALLYPIGLRPCLYYFIYTMHLDGAVARTPDMQCMALGKFQMSLFLRVVTMYDKLVLCRISNAERLFHIVQKCRHFSCIVPLERSRPVYPSFPVLAPYMRTRDLVCARLRAAGIAASSLFKKAPDETHVSEHGDELYRRLFVLPTIPFLNDTHFMTIQSVLSEFDTRGA